MNAIFSGDIPLTQAVIAALAANPTCFRTNTPIDVLAAHMVRSLELFEQSIIDRGNHPFYAPGRHDP